MPLKLYQMQVLAGVLLIALLEGALALGAGLTNGIVGAVEGAGFLFCCIGVAAGGRDLRGAFIALGSDRGLARQDREYMRSRTQVQVTAVAATAAVGLVAARHLNIPPVAPLAGATALGLSLPFINRATGWASSA